MTTNINARVTVVSRLGSDVRIHPDHAKAYKLNPESFALGATEDRFSRNGFPYSVTQILLSGFAVGEIIHSEE